MAKTIQFELWCKSEKNGLHSKMVTANSIQEALEKLCSVEDEVDIELVGVLEATLVNEEVDWNSTPVLERAKINIQHMIDGGRCLSKNTEHEIFQGTNGNFYYQLTKDSVKLFNGQFCNLKRKDK